MTWLSEEAKYLTWRLSSSACEQCKAMTVRVAQDRDDDADYTIHCTTCGMHYRADGPDD